MLDLQVVTTTPAHNNGGKTTVKTCVIMLINRTATASIVDVGCIISSRFKCSLHLPDLAQL